jgi:hypothetical protein
MKQSVEVTVRMGELEAGDGIRRALHHRVDMRGCRSEDQGGCNCGSITSTWTRRDVVGRDSNDGGLGEEQQQGSITEVEGSRRVEFGGNWFGDGVVTAGEKGGGLAGFV